VKNNRNETSIMAENNEKWQAINGKVAGSNGVI